MCPHGAFLGHRIFYNVYKIHDAVYLYMCRLGGLSYYRSTAVYIAIMNRGMSYGK